MRRLVGATALACLAGGLVLIAQGFWIPAKGWLAQQLLERAWQQVLAGATTAKPWAHADGQPLARLRWPDGDIEQIVLSQASGRILAFGPAHVPPSARPGQPGHVVISAHRDTHFRFLGRLRTGDRLELESVHGIAHYQVTGREILDLRRQHFALDPDHHRLTLVTCYPLSGWRAGTPRRLLVHLAPAPA